MCISLSSSYSIAYHKHLLVVIYMTVADSTTSVQTDGNYKMNEADFFYTIMYIVPICYFIKLIIY